MKTLLEYINENIDELKSNIKNALNDINNEKLLKKIYNNIKISDKDYVKYKRNLERRLQLIGLNETTINAIKQKIKHYGKIEEFNKIMERHHKQYLISSSKLIKNTNIFTLIENELKDKIDIDDNFKKLLHDLADFDLPNKSIGKGKMEILSQIFLKDLINQNKGNADINCENRALEYKLSSARIKGGSVNIKDPKIINETFIKLLSNYLNENIENDNNKNDLGSSCIRYSNNDEKLIDKIDKNLNFNINQENIFSSGKAIKAYFKDLYTIYINEPQSYIDELTENINKFIIESLISQIGNEIDNKKIKSYCEKYKIIIPNIKKDNVTFDENGINNFKKIFLLIHLFNYQKTEGWTHLLLFAKDGGSDDVEIQDIEYVNPNLNGNYVVITNTKGDIADLDSQISEYKIYNNTFPFYNGPTPHGGKITKASERNYVPTINYNSK